MAPASATIEFLPGALGLGKAVGDGVDDRRMMAEAAVAAIDLDVLGPSSFRQACQAQMPSVRLKMEVVGTGGGSASASRRYCSSILRPLAIS
jgi:hypothetical protein